MKNLFLNIDPSNKQTKKTIGNFIRRKMLIEKEFSWIIFAFFLLISIILAYTISSFGISIGFLEVTILVSIPILYYVIIKPEFGIILYLTLAYTFFYISRLRITGDFPLGTLMDGLLLLFIFVLLIQMKEKNEWHLLKNKISFFIILWVFYNIIQVFNPSAESKLAWVYTIRSMALVTLMYFIFVFNIRTKKFIRTILKWWILWSILNAFYAIKQEYLGFSNIEQHLLDINPQLATLLYVGGHWRKFSIFADPVTFAYNMDAAIFLCLALITGPMKMYKKILLGFLVILFFNVMLFSGTRSANPLIPIGLVLFAILKFNKKVLLFTISALFFIIFLIFLPTSNSNLFRFQTAFRPKQDESYQAREVNQALIKPYIYSHPFGGGLGATGEWGSRFSANSYLGKFQPDSGYVRTTVELGWIGLLLFSMMIFVILQTGIINYFKILDPELKSYLLAVVLMVFIWNIGNFPQQAIVQYPSNVLFFLAVALIVAIYRIDQQQNLVVDEKH